MQEILLSLHPEYWDLIKSGKKTIEVRKTRPLLMHYPFRVIVYVTGGVGVVGKFDCNETISTIRPELLIEGSCMTAAQLLECANGKTLCGWRIKPGSVVEYETPFPLETATGFKQPPKSWCYLKRD